MRKLQNTLYITTQGSYLHKERETLVVEQERKKVAQLPVHSIGHIFCFGNVLVSPFLLGFCGENNVNLAFFTENGRFLGRLQGRQSGNVLLRRAQYRVSEQNPVPIARNIIAAKIQASKRVLQRQIRNYGENAAIQSAVDALNISLRQLKGAAELDVVRGIEGDAAARYFGVFGQLLSEKSGFTFDGRNRRPPRDGVSVQHLGQGHQRRAARRGAGSAGGFSARRPAGARQFGAGYFGRIPRVVGGQVGVVAD